jgi:signal transduction histidine kinase
MIRRKIIEDKLTEYAADLERTMDELVEAKKNADAAVLAKSFFLANISHEIRTPMAAILGCIDMLVGAKEGKPTSLNQEQLVDIIQKSSKDLMTTIDDVLTYSSIDTNRIVLESAPIDLRQLVEDVKIIAGSLFEAKPQLQLRTEWEDSVPNVIMGDPARIRQILLALISNAVKFTETGHITVRCSSILLSENSGQTRTIHSAPTFSSTISTPFLSPQIAHAKGLRGTMHVTSAEQDGPHTTDNPSTQMLDTWRTLPTALLLRIDVSDTGIGIAKEQFGTLFKQFSQVDGTSTRKFGGVGLGLSIVKGLVELMEGDVQAASNPGQGSTFSVFIPVSGREDSIIWHKQQQSHSQRHTQQGQLPLQGYHILAVDDVLVNQIVVETQLRNMGAKVRSAPNGKIAVDLALEAEDSALPFDLILMDLQMPTMDGFEATRTLRKRGFTKPVVALSANRDSDKEALEAGCNLILSKPADPEVLLGTIVSLAQKTTGRR